MDDPLFAVCGALVDPDAPPCLLPEDHDDLHCNGDGCRWGKATPQAIKDLLEGVI